MSVKVSYHHEDGAWWADSPDIEGMTVMAPTFEELRVETRDAVAFLTDDETDVVETLSESANRVLTPWAGIVDNRARQVPRAAIRSRFVPRHSPHRVITV